uniref:Uncharacterized protein n=1 Tax=Pyxicephalus adspersus TaxID=30357 RepID=A0AAV3AM10_PYXAD|nr:TPA: hypothetical protein GDO54_009146 [Pyxicephalus adspersus]
MGRREQQDHLIHCYFCCVNKSGFSAQMDFLQHEMCFRHLIERSIILYKRHCNSILGTYLPPRVNGTKEVPYTVIFLKLSQIFHFLISLSFFLNTLVGDAESAKLKNMQ